MSKSSIMAPNFRKKRVNISMQYDILSFFITLNLTKEGKWNKW